MLADAGIPLELMPRTAPLDPLDSAFCSPEELAGRPIDARSNVFSLGVLLRTTLRASANGSGKVPEAAESVIERATAARPEKRYPGPKDFMIAAAAALDVQVRVRPERNAEGVPAPPEPLPEPEPAPKRPRQARDRPQRAKPGPVLKEAPPAEPAPSSRAPSKARGRAPEPVAERRSMPVPPRRRLRGRSRPRLRMPQLSLPSLPRLSLPSPRRVRLNLAGVPRPRPPRLSLRAILRDYVRLPALAAKRVRSEPSMRALGVAVALATCVIGGLLLAKLVDGDQDGGAQISSAALSVQLPDGWDTTKVEPEPSIALSAPVAAAPLGESGTGLVAGRVEDPAELDKRLSAESTQRTEVTLGRLEAWRYSGLEPEQGLAAVAYLAPTSDGSVLVICHARRPVAPERLRECEAIASTIVLRGARPAALASVGEGRARGERRDGQAPRRAPGRPP